MKAWQLRPARDHGLPPGERLRSHGREHGLAGTATHWLWRRVVRGYLHGFHRLAVLGRENLPTRPPFVIVANHASHLDALVLAAVLPERCARRAYALAAGDTFFTSAAVSAFAAYAINALPIWRQRTTPRDIATLRDRLAEDELVFVLFPEGTRSRDGAMGRFRPGVGAFVAGTSIPVVPCYLDGAHEAWPPNRRLPRPGRLILTIGAPLRFPETANDRTGWMSVAAACEASVHGLAASPAAAARTGRTGGRR